MGYPSLTAPFVLATWLIMFCVYKFGYSKAGFLIVPAIPDSKAALELGQISGMTFWRGITKGVGEVMFQDNVITGIIFVIAILVNSRISAVLAVLGTAFGLLTPLAMRSPGLPIRLGLYGFNSVLCGIAIGRVFFSLDWISTLYAIACILGGSIAMDSISVFLAPISMSTLTWSFIIVTWFFLSGKGIFSNVRAVPLAEVGKPEDNLKALKNEG